MINKKILYLHAKISFLVLNICILSKIQGQETTLELRVTGKDSLETSIIDSIPYKNHFKTYQNLVKETDSIELKLEHAGYLNRERQSLIKKNDSVFHLHFFLNKKFRQLKVHYSSSLFPLDIIKKISSKYTKKYFLIPFSQTEEVLNFLTRHLTNQGNTFASLQLRDITPVNDTITATLQYQTSTKRIIDNIILKGYEEFPKTYLSHYSNIKKKQQFSKKTLLKKAQSLNNLPFSSVTRPPEVLFTKDSTAIYLYLSKKNANTFDGFIGFSNSEDNQQLIFDGYLNLNLINNLNFGEALRFIYKSDGNEQQRLQINATLPYLFKTPLTVETGLEIFKKDTTFVNTEQLVNLHYTINTRNTTYLGYKSNASDNLLQTPQVGINVNSFDASYFTGGYSYKTFQNNALFPQKTTLSLDLEVGKRNTASLKNTQQKAKSRIQHILNLNPRNSIYFSNSLAALFSDTYVFNELFRFGGITSIRGFEENSLNASFYNVVNTEYRFLLSSNLYIHSILDYAYFEDKNNDLNDNLNSFGFGIGLNTKSGLFKINFANGKTGTQSFKFSNTKVHLSLIAFF